MKSGKILLHRTLSHKYEVKMINIDCSNLIREMKKKGITCHELAFLLGEENEAIESKMQGTSEWIYEEVITIRDTLFPEHELGYLFKEKKRQDA